MKFLFAAILIAVLADLGLAHGANTSHVLSATTHFFHWLGGSAEDSIFTK